MKEIQKNKKTAFGGIFVGCIFALTTLFLPIKAISSILPSKTYATDVYSTTNKISVSNSNFETVATGTTYTPSNWTASIDATKDTTVISGTMDTTIKNWDNVYEGIVDTWIANWKTNNSALTNKDAIAIDLKTDLMTNRQFINPINSSMTNANSTTGNNVLVVNAGKTYNDYADLTDTTANSGYLKYTSDKFTLSAYSYYKVSVFVKTVGATANITISGDLSNAKTNISTAESTTVYYLYDWSNNDTTPTTGQYISSDYISSPVADDTIVVNGIQYKYNATESKFVADPAGTGYVAEYANYTVTYNSSKTYTTGSSSDWTEYNFYISTRESASIALELGIGTELVTSSGVAFFDNITVEQVQITDYSDAIENATTNKFSTRHNLSIFENFEISDTNLDGKTDILDSGFTYLPRVGGLEGISSAIVDEETETGIEPTFIGTGSPNTNKVLKITNTDSSSVSFKTDKVTINQLKYYRVSFWVRTDNGETYLTKNAALTSTIKAILNEKEVSTSTSATPYITRTNSDNSIAQNVNNYWKEVSFYILGCPLYDTEAWFEISITKPCTLYFDNFTIEEVLNNDYTNAGGTKLALNTTVPSEKIANGYFTKYNNVEFADFNNPLPATNWTLESTYKKDVYLYYADLTSNATSFVAIENNSDVTIVGETATYNSENYTQSADDNKTYTLGTTKKIVVVQDVEFTWDSTKSAYYNSTYKATIPVTYFTSGIVPTNNKTTIFDNYKAAIGLTTNPNEKENCLALYASADATFDYKSSAIALAANTVYRVSVWVWTNDSIGTIRLSSENTTYSEIENIDTTSAWKEYVIYVYTGAQSTNLYLTLGIDGQNTVLYKNVNYTSYSSTTNFNDKLSQDSVQLAADRISVVDLSNETFAERSATVNPVSKLFDSLCYKPVEISGTVSGTWGILDTKNADSAYSAIKSMDDEVSPYVMLIKNEANQSTKITSSKSIVLSASKYYKITINAKTTDIAESKFATLSFENISTTFKMNTANYTNEETNDYKTYTLYISTGTTATNLNPTLSLLATSGTLLVDSIKMETIEESDFEAVEELENTDEQIVLDLTVEDDLDDDIKDDVEDEEETEENKSNSLEIFFVVLSSIILVGAILIAVIFSGAKRLPKHKRAKINKKYETGDEDDEKGFI